MARFEKPIQREIKGMGVGDTASFPLESLSVVRVAASDIGIVFRRRYVTSCDRKAGVIWVTRKE